MANSPMTNMAIRIFWILLAVLAFKGLLTLNHRMHDEDGLFAKYDYEGEEPDELFDPSSWTIWSDLKRWYNKYSYELFEGSDGEDSLVDEDELLLED